MALDTLPTRQQEEMGTVGTLYKNSAGCYLSEKRLDTHLVVIVSFLSYIHQRGKWVRTVTEQDLYDYFIWLARRECTLAAWSATAVGLIDFFHVLRQEGTIQQNPLFRVYRILVDGEKLWSEATWQPLSHETGLHAAPPPKHPPSLPLPDAAPGATFPRVHNTTPAAVMPATAAATRDRSRRIVPPGSGQPAEADLPPPSIWRRLTRHQWLLASLPVLLLAILVQIGFRQGIEPPSGTEPALATGGTGTGTGQDKGGASTPPAGSMRTAMARRKRPVDFFDQHDMKDYYCRDYLQMPCPSTQPTAVPIPADPDNIYAGKEHFLGQCARCHGDSGLGNGPEAARLNLSMAMLRQVGGDLPDRDAYLFWITAEGGRAFGGSMPPFKERLDEKSIWQVVLFLKTLH
ncbi:MAG: c-type cytochrome [Magnetococcus sp. DMHC-8]